MFLYVLLLKVYILTASDYLVPQIKVFIIKFYGLYQAWGTHL